MRSVLAILALFPALSGCAAAAVVAAGTAGMAGTVIEYPNEVRVVSRGTLTHTLHADHGPLYCYETLGVAECHRAPLASWERRRLVDSIDPAAGRNPESAGNVHEEADSGEENAFLRRISREFVPVIRPFPITELN